ncbi:fused uroporphyrinogen-III synthase HemD/membrane protein HemX [Cupriavidus sp. AU9028]|uniref:fused uroporphyrinogen-III synthase HemD/membrane protein HemX n=1 Tax=Cupriavidus sp. AU9028 TaxID=2871157 RepID=UPI001C952983|nr:fused uroporphyrinogen-III synthase HemD/membrane protein HemX [Cupriavidus sp. AU9028]MBY4898097.1 fused uroporphyrinogen-III synthase HemD/membrane protein HemX [Cupriavidus sp. AU9028]
MLRPTVVVTRPAGQSRQLIDALQAAGLDVLSFPLLAIGPATDDGPLRAALGELERFALVVFVSPNAIAYALDALASQQGVLDPAWPISVPVAVVGPASVAALAARGIAAPTHRVISPLDPAAAPAANDVDPRFDSEALWARLDPAELRGRSVLIVRGNGGRDWLAERLREAGATVVAVQAYRRDLPEPGAMQWQAVRESLADGAAPHAWLLTSSEAVRNLDTLAGQHLSPDEVQRLRQVQCIAAHARIAEQADALGFRRIGAASPGDDGLLQACLAWARERGWQPAAPTPAEPAAPAAAAQASPPDPSHSSTSTKADRVTQQNSNSTAPPNTAQTDARARTNGAATPATATAGKGRGAIAWLLLVIVLLAGGAAFWWLQQRVDRLTEELARRQQSNDSLVQESRVLTREAQSTIKEMQAKVGALEARIDDTRDKQATLEQVYQDLMRNRDDWELAEIQQLLTNAGQQLQLTGNVQVALSALQSADVRLARSDKPETNELRRAIARDIASMKAVPEMDLTGAAIKLDEAINQIDALPLLSGERMLERGDAAAPASAAAAPDAAAASAPEAAPGGGSRIAAAGERLARWAEGLWATVRDELAQVIRVRRVDNTDALLMSGDQGWFLRENIKLRLLNARLALLSRNETVFRNDLAGAQDMIARYFDGNSRRVQTVQTLLKQAQAGAVSVQLPTMAESLGALRALKKE